MGAAAVAAVMRRREREVIDDFRAAGAVSRETTQSYTDRDGLSRHSRPDSVRCADGDHQDVIRAVAIQSGRSIFRQGIISGAAGYAVAAAQLSGTTCLTS